MMLPEDPTDHYTHLKNCGKFKNLSKKTLQNLQKKFPEFYAEPTFPVDRSNVGVTFEHDIQLEDPTKPPPKKKLYMLDDQELKALKEQLQKFLDSGRIAPTNSPYGAPILFAKKKDGGLRMCIDYRQLNSNTVKDTFPLPCIKELLHRLRGAKVFSKLDLRDGYHQISMKEEA